MCIIVLLHAFFKEIGDRMSYHDSVSLSLSSEKVISAISTSCFFWMVDQRFIWNRVFISAEVLSSSLSVIVPRCILVVVLSEMTWLCFSLLVYSFNFVLTVFSVEDKFLNFVEDLLQQERRHTTHNLRASRLRTTKNTKRKKPWRELKNTNSHRTAKAP